MNAILHVFRLFWDCPVIFIEQVKFIPDSPVRRAEKPRRFGKPGIPYQCLRSRHPK